MGHVILIWMMHDTPFLFILYKLQVMKVLLSSFQHYDIIASSEILNSIFLRECMALINKVGCANVNHFGATLAKHFARGDVLNGHLDKYSCRTRSMWMRGDDIALNFHRVAFRECRESCFEIARKPCIMTLRDVADRHGDPRHSTNVDLTLSQRHSSQFNLSRNSQWYISYLIHQYQT